MSKKDNDGGFSVFFAFTWLLLFMFFIGTIYSSEPQGEYAYDISNLGCKQFIAKYPNMEIDGNINNVEKWIPVSCLNDFNIFYARSSLSKRAAWNEFKSKILS